MWNAAERDNSLTLVTPEFVLGTLIQIIAEETTHFAHTLGVLKRIQKDFPEVATHEFVMRHVEAADFFKPDGLLKMGKGLGMPDEKLKVLLKELCQ